KQQLNHFLFQLPGALLHPSYHYSNQNQWMTRVFPLSYRGTYFSAYVTNNISRPINPQRTKIYQCTIFIEEYTVYIIGFIIYVYPCHAFLPPDPLSKYFIYLF